MTIVRLLDLVLVVIIRNLLKNQKNYLSLKNCLSQEKNGQKVGIYINSLLKKLNQTS